MIQLLIVEDEAAIAQGIAAVIGDMGLPFSKVCVCSDGEQALWRMEEEEFELVITDIRMPVMDGISLIEQAKERFPETEFVILSGYSDFQYARQAIRLGVNNYIVKPPLYEELYQTLKTLCGQIGDRIERKRSEEIRALLFQGSCEGKRLPPLNNRYAYLILACAGPLSKWADYPLPGPGEIWNPNEMRREFEKAEGDEQCVIIEGGTTNERIFFLTAGEPGIMPVKRLMNRITDCGKQIGMPIQAVISGTLRTYGEMAGLYRNLRLCLSRTALIGRSHIAMLQPEEEEAAVMALTGEELLEFRQCIKREEPGELTACFRRIGARWQKEKVSRMNCEFSTKYLATEFYRNETVLHKGYRSEELLSQVEVIVEAALTFEQFIADICELFSDMEAKIRGTKADKTIGDVVELLYDTIREQYAEPLSIEAFAKVYGYHPVYLANCFAKKKKLTPGRLLVKCRMERAKDLLGNTGLSVRRVAEAVGYQDVSYFSRVFKEVTGESPGQYNRGRGRKPSDPA